MSAIFIGGLPLSLWVVLLSTLPAETLLRWDNIKAGPGRFVAPILFNTAQVMVSVGAAAVVFEQLSTVNPSILFLFMVKSASFVTYVVVNNSLVAGMITISSGESFFRTLRTGLKNLHLQFATMGVLAILIATLYEVSPVYLFLSLVPLTLVHYATRNYIRLRQESHRAFKHITDMLAERDEYTGSHSADVEALAVKLAIAMKLPDDDIEAIRAGAAIHDIGKIAIPDAILKKLGPLDDQEFETMKQHTIIGSDIIANMEIYRNVVPIVRHEHEHWDGLGYPDGLIGEAIPMGARVVAVADVYSALTTEREYRVSQGKPLKYTPEEACDVLLTMAGTVLDPELTRMFVTMIRKSAA
jgi:HD-GYP domain-containing protein (c-di-GMP phosphodiesterase class II)